MFKKKLLFSLLLSIFFIIGKSPVWASGEFETSCKAIYKVGENGEVNVSQEITIENLKADIYVSEYSVKINNPEVKNVSAWDGKGSILVEAKREAGETNLKLSFNEEVVGIGNSLFFILKYDIPNFVKREGLVRRILIPGLSLENLPKQYSVEIYVPNSLGQLSFSSPETIIFEKQVKSTVYKFSKSEIAKSGIILDFGDHQVFDFSLNYQIENPEDFIILKNISLPPDTEYQTVRYLKIEPPPQNVQRDNDGNWLASYKLSPKENLKIIALGKVKLFSSPINQFNQNPLNLEKYLDEKVFWEVNHPKIKSLSQNLKSPKEIYDFVVKELEYNYDRVSSESKRLGALASLEEPKNCLCTEFTDLFVTLARSSGIPTREIEGYAYTNNPKQKIYDLTRDILHSWPQFYDQSKKTWRMVDPTWEKTTSSYGYFDNFDMSHFTFVIHGLDSQLPLPAGTFKAKNNTEKSISVQFGEDLGFEDQTKIETEIILDPVTIFSKYNNGDLRIKNLGPAATYNNQLEVTPKNQLNPILETTSVPVLVPYASLLIPIKINNPNYFFNKIKDSSFTLMINDRLFEEKIEVKTYTPNYFYVFFFLIFLVFFLASYKLLLKFRQKIVKLI